jgi:hypothetical protein
VADLLRFQRKRKLKKWPVEVITSLEDKPPFAFRKGESIRSGLSDKTDNYAKQPKVSMEEKERGGGKKRVLTRGGGDKERRARLSACVEDLLLSTPA